MFVHPPSLCILQATCTFLQRGYMCASRRSGDRETIITCPDPNSEFVTYEAVYVLLSGQIAARLSLLLPSRLQTTVCALAEDTASIDAIRSTSPPCFYLFLIAMLQRQEKGETFFHDKNSNRNAFILEDPGQGIGNQKTAGLHRASVDNTDKRSGCLFVTNSLKGPRSAQELLHKPTDPTLGW